MFGVAYTSKIYSQVPKHKILPKKLPNLGIRVIDALVTAKRQYVKLDSRPHFCPSLSKAGAGQGWSPRSVALNGEGSQAYPKSLDLGENVSKRQTYSTGV
jgi:hypothetical protein